MSLSGKQWIWLDQDSDQAARLAGSLNLPPALARLLLNRGISDPGQARAFLCPSPEQFHSPWIMSGMKPAVDRITDALDRGEKIMIHGDYDADGIAASVILVEALQRLGAKVEFYLPSRFDEGYGLHREPLQQFKDAGIGLVVTVDCGINAAEEAAFASSIGLDLIVTDHHQPLGSLQGPVAVINPLQEKCPYPFKELSGAGIAFKLASALFEKLNHPFPDWLLDLAALGTAADVVPLLGENRVIVSSGLEILRSLQRVGFKALAEAVSLKEEKISSTSLSFALAPAVNAAGRMGEALPAAELLLENDMGRAGELAVQLHRANQLRRSTEQKILAEAQEIVLNRPKEAGERVITLASDKWHHGVIGIVASRLVEAFNRPVALIAVEDGEGRGSARSIAGFNITAALADSSALLDRFGGHEQAAGFTIRADKIDLLRENLNRHALDNLDDDRLNPRLYLETELDADDIGFDLTAHLEQLQPFGTANPVPLFGSRGWEILSWRLVGADRSHLKLSVKKDAQILNPIVFSGASFEPDLEKGRVVDLAFKLKDGFFHKEKTLEVEVKDINYSDCLIYGGLELIDRRNRKNRQGYLNELLFRLTRQNMKAVVFTASLSRSRRIEKICRAREQLCLVTSNLNNGKLELPEGPVAIIIYDLPLYQGLLKPLLEAYSKQEKLPVYLLYGEEDVKLNRRLAELSLPDVNRLETIMKVFTGAKQPGHAAGFPGPAADSLDIKPAPSFWERAEKIFNEIGLLENGRPAPNRETVTAGWPDCLASSPTFKAAEELRKNCEQFQNLLLEGTLEEIAAFLNNLFKNS